MAKNTSKIKGNVESNKDVSTITGNPNLDKGAWKPGQSGNPKGRPVGAKTGLRARLMQMLDQQADADILKAFEAKGIELGDKDRAAVIAYVVGRQALKGNMNAVKIIADQTEAPLPKTLEHGGVGGAPIPIQYIIQPVRPAQIESGEKEQEDGDEEEA